MIPYSKPALSNEQLLAFLERQGVEVGDRDAALRDLRRIGYYRLKIYTRPFQPDHGTFRQGVTFADVVSLYEFDRRLRLVGMDAIERIEVSLRSAIIEAATDAGGPHFYYDEAHFSDPHQSTKFRELVQKSSGQHLSISHYMRKYNEPYLPPAWCILEASTFGWISKTYGNLSISLKKRVASFYGFNQVVLVSWFRTLATFRNMCAHHHRIWNADMKVDAPKVAKAFRGHLNGLQDTFYIRAFIIMALLKNLSEGEADAWRVEFCDVLEAADPHMLRSMGFPIDWAEHPIWTPRAEAGA